MNPLRRHLLLLSAGLMLAGTAGLTAADAPNPAEIKRITDRYALTHARIAALLDQRLHPVPLPANPPNPFYQAPKEVTAGPPGPGAEKPETALVPETADISDIDTLRKYSTILKIGGVINRNDTLYLIVNNTPCKVGDIITVGNKDHPSYLKMVDLSTSDYTLGLNDATLVVPLKK